MKKTEAMHAITKAFSILDGIEDANDLKKQRLTLADYHAARDIFGQLSTPGSSAKTFLQGVADFYSRAGFTVTMEPAGVNYIISTK